jgi:hypothetical protein
MSNQPPELPKALVTALEWYDQYVEGGEKDNTLLARCASQMANLGGESNHFMALINRLAGYGGDRTTASLAIFSIMAQGNYGNYPQDIKEKIKKMAKAISSAY